MPTPGFYTKFHRTYVSWYGAKYRCLNKKARKWKNYGGRGIEICERWKNDFAAFLADMGERPPGTSLDRIDNDGDYEPGNCRWATCKQQQRNKRNTKWIEYNGVVKDAASWVDEFGMNGRILVNRVRNGWDAEVAFETPVSPVGPGRRGRPSFSGLNDSLTKNGITKPVRKWLEELDIPIHQFVMRRQRGRSIEDAVFFTKKKGGRGNKVTVRGLTKYLQEWLNEAGITYGLYKFRLDVGFSVEEALFKKKWKKRPGYAKGE